MSVDFRCFHATQRIDECSMGRSNPFGWVNPGDTLDNGSEDGDGEWPEPVVGPTDGPIFDLSKAITEIDDPDGHVIVSRRSGFCVPFDQ